MYIKDFFRNNQIKQKSSCKTRVRAEELYRKYVYKFVLDIFQTSFRFDRLTVKLFLHTKMFQKVRYMYQNRSLQIFRKTRKKYTKSVKGQIDPGGPPRQGRQRRVLRTIYYSDVHYNNFFRNNQIQQKSSCRTRVRVEELYGKYVYKFVLDVFQTSFRFDSLTVKLFLYTKMFQKVGYSYQDNE